MSFIRKLAKAAKGQNDIDLVINDKEQEGGGNSSNDRNAASSKS